MPKDPNLQIRIDSGWMVADPADPHRWLLITYTVSEDCVRVFRRCEELDKAATEPTEN
ncbi:hypothetical protein LCGC14_2218550 [marine sediment metagenome]|uniref:Uncharacterized protein n=1 Tax=marine sediment metagenome TaxID=412755 RepID=A0A0F9FP85_9ZZZZ